MLEWIKENKEWLFSGVAVTVIGAGIGWFRSKRGSGTSGNSVQQSHTGSGDNVGGDKNVNG